MCLSASYNYDCVGRLFWCARGCFCAQALSPNGGPGLLLVHVRKWRAFPNQMGDFVAGAPNFPCRWRSVRGRGGSFSGVPIHTPSHLWITVLVTSGFGGLIQIRLFVNTATSPKLI